MQRREKATLLSAIVSARLGILILKYYGEKCVMVALIRKPDPNETITGICGGPFRGNASGPIDCQCGGCEALLLTSTPDVAPYQLDRYLAEQVYRFDERKGKDGPRFEKALKRTDGAGSPGRHSRTRPCDRTP